MRPSHRERRGNRLRFGSYTGCSWKLSGFESAESEKIERGIEWSRSVLAIFCLSSNCLQKIWLVFASSCSQDVFQLSTCSNFFLKFSAVKRKHNLNLGSKIDAGNNVSSFAQVGNVGETYTRYIMNISGTRWRIFETSWLASKNSSQKAPAKVESNLET